MKKEIWGSFENGAGKVYDKTELIASDFKNEMEKAQFLLEVKNFIKEEEEEWARKNKEIEAYNSATSEVVEIQGQKVRKEALKEKVYEKPIFNITEQPNKVIVNMKYDKEMKGLSERLKEKFENKGAER